MVQLQDIRDGTEAFLEIGDLLERIPELNDGCLVEHSVLAHYKLAML